MRTPAVQRQTLGIALHSSDPVLKQRAAPKPPSVNNNQPRAQVRANIAARATAAAASTGVYTSKGVKKPADVNVGTHVNAIV